MGESTFTPYITLDLPTCLKVEKGLTSRFCGFRCHESAFLNDLSLALLSVMLKAAFNQTQWLLLAKKGKTISKLIGWIAAPPAHSDSGKYRFIYIYIYICIRRHPQTIKNLPKILLVLRSKNLWERGGGTSTSELTLLQPRVLVFGWERSRSSSWFGGSMQSPTWRRLKNTPRH